jgi:hypothetical protein
VDEFGAALDALAEALTRGEGGRLLPGLTRFDEEVGVLHPEESGVDELRVLRVDYACCDHELAGVGDTWLARVLAGTVSGVPRDGPWEALAESWSGTFEVFAGDPPWLRDGRAGMCAPLLDPITVAGESLLWEARVVLRDGGARLCRRPLTLPHEWGPALELRRGAWLAGGERPSPWPLLRGALRLLRNPRQGSWAALGWPRP